MDGWLSALYGGFSFSFTSAPGLTYFLFTSVSRGRGPIFLFFERTQGSAFWGCMIIGTFFCSPHTRKMERTRRMLKRYENLAWKSDRDRDEWDAHTGIITHMRVHVELLIQCAHVPPGDPTRRIQDTTISAKWKRFHSREMEIELPSRNKNIFPP